MRSIPFYSLVEPYLSFKTHYNKPRTIQSARQSLKMLADHLGSTDLYSITASDIAGFVEKRLRVVVPISVNKDLRMLKTYLRWCVDEGHIEKVPCKIKMLKAPKRRELALLTSENINKLLDCAREPFRGIIMVAAATGMRLSEILNLTWEDIHFEEERLAIRGKNGWTTKSHQIRSVFIPEKVGTYLKGRKESVSNSADGDYVFSSRTKTAFDASNVCAIMQGIWKEAGLYKKGQPTMHSLRHNFCSQLLGAGIDIETCRVLLGHASCNTTFLYAHPHEKSKRQAANVVVF